MNKLFLKFFGSKACAGGLLMALSQATMSFAHADVAVIVNLANSTDSMSKQEVAAHYLKEKKVWAFGKKIRPIAIKGGSSTQDEFISRVLGMTEGDIVRYWIEQQYARAMKPPTEVSDDSDVIRFVKKFEGAIGFVDASSTNSSVKTVYTFK